MLAADAGEAWMRAARRGDFAAAWDISDDLLRLRRGTRPDPHVPRHEQWVWDGRDLNDRDVLVRCYHGLGDTIQFARLLPRLAEVARHVMVWVQPPLMPLISRMPGVTAALPLHDGTPEVDYDVDVEIMEIAHVLRMTLETLPSRVPYLCAPRAARLAEGFSVGVVATAGDWDPRRSIPGAVMSAAIGAVAGVTGFSLHPQQPLPGMCDASTPDLLTLAGRLQALDLVITVDTMVAHLAGALGVPVWTLLPYDADWRWLAARADSPWYPTMRLFRQPRPRAWRPLLDEVAAALEVACAH